MRKITLRLTEAEYFALEQRARNERRSVREMAEYLVVQKPLIRLQGPFAPIQTAPFTPNWPPNVWCDTTTNVAMDLPSLPLSISRDD